VETLIAWAGFVGAWLLVAGPVFQASVELQSEGEVMDRVRSHLQNIPRPEPVSVWWWLLPPVRVVLQSRRSDRHREALLAELSREEFEAITRFKKIARGWMYVALGAWLIAWKETWELVEHEEWPTALFWVLLVVMTLAALGLTVVSASRERDLVHRTR
jgi:hypothetical protein